MTLPILFPLPFVVVFEAVITPGPISTAIVSDSTRRGFVVGPLVATGLVLLEFGMFVLLALGVSSGLHTPPDRAVVSLLGGQCSFGWVEAWCGAPSGPAGAAQAGRPTQTAEQPPTTRTPRRRHVGQPVVIRLVVDRGDELPGHSRDAGLWAGSVIGFLFRPHCQRLLLELHLVGSGGRRPSLDYRRRLQVVDRHLRHVPRITGRHVLHVPISQLKPTICPVRVLYSNGRLQVLALAAVYR